MAGAAPPEVDASLQKLMEIESSTALLEIETCFLIWLGQSRA